jgi:hypothetical protein
MEGWWKIKYHPRTKADEDWPTALEAEEDVKISTAALRLGFSPKG